MIGTMHGQTFGPVVVVVAVVGLVVVDRVLVVDLDLVAVVVLTMLAVKIPYGFDICLMNVCWMQTKCLVQGGDGRHDVPCLHLGQLH